ncbi:hypothetical protein [Mariniluteicoccus endophyticus]
MNRIATTTTALLAAAGLALTGCSGGGETQKAGSTPSGAAQPQQVPANQPEGAAKDLKDMKCAAEPSGEWNFSGKVTNSSDKDSEYTVKVSVIKKQGSTVVASKDIVQKVAKGQTAELKLDRFAKPTEKADELSCVPTTTVKRG